MFAAGLAQAQPTTYIDCLVTQQQLVGELT